MFDNKPFESMKDKQRALDRINDLMGICTSDEQYRGYSKTEQEIRETPCCQEIKTRRKTLRKRCKTNI